MAKKVDYSIVIDNKRDLVTAKSTVDAAREALKEADEQLAKALESFEASM